MRPAKLKLGWQHLLSLLASLTVAAMASAQQSAPAPSAVEEEELPATVDSRSGYVDSAVPLNQVRLRTDFGYNNRQPTRAEFFYAATAPIGPGLPRPEPSVDFQDVSLYLERKFSQRLSAFIEVPFRFGNYDVNGNQSGLSDITAGFKFAFLQTDDTLATLQFRVYTPTGDAFKGLGTDHYSFEPALLLYHSFSERLASESEFRFWIPSGGTDQVQGEVIRYGTGVSYKVWEDGCRWIAPVVEAVGWTFLDGQTTPPTVAGDNVRVQSAAGDTVINGKLGVRFRLGENSEFYGGYGRALMGEVLYKDMYRFEFRLLF
jgi:hypothetical protein